MIGQKKEYFDIYDSYESLLRKIERSGSNNQQKVLTFLSWFLLEYDSVVPTLITRKSEILLRRIKFLLSFLADKSLSNVTTTES